MATDAAHLWMPSGFSTRWMSKRIAYTGERRVVTSSVVHSAARMSWSLVYDAIDDLQAYTFGQHTVHLVDESVCRM